MIKRDSTARFSFGIYICISVIVLCVFASCATHRDASDLRNELKALSTATESRLYSIEQSIASLDSILREQRALSQSIRALVGTQAQEQRDNIASLTARQDEINYQIRELLNTLQAIQLYGGISPEKSGEKPAASSTPSILPPKEKTMVVRTPSATIEVKPEELFKSSLDDINNGNYALAESRLLTFLIQFPDNELSGNAQYWLGEAVYGQQKYELAIKEFDKLINKYRKSSKIPAALLKKGLAQIEIGHNKSARTTLKKLVSSYPKSQEAKEAREKLNSL